MADPNTQIDWWIAQTWQESQGGAENDALVAWLHENGLTAASSYTILQAALSCPPDTAKEIVYGHPAWTGAEPDADVANLNYTTETLEPEPEPDPTFELDEWAEQIEEEEAPVYGEEGFQADPDAGASPQAYNRETPAPNGAGRTLLLDPAQSDAGEPAQAGDELGALDDPDGLEDDARESDADAGIDVAEDGPAEPSNASRDAEITENAPSAREPAPADSDQSAATERSVPETGDPAPAQPDPEPRQSAKAAVAMPPPLVYQPLPDVQIAPPVAPAAPLFALPRRDRQSAAPLFPPTDTADQAATANDGPTMALPESDPAPLPEASAEQPGSEPVLAVNGLDPYAVQDSTIQEEVPETPPAATTNGTGSLRSGNQAAMKHDEAEPPGEAATVPNEEGGEPAPTDLEPDLAPEDDGEASDLAPQDVGESPELAPRDDGEASDLAPEDEGQEPEAPPAAVMDSTSDLPAGMPQALGQPEADPQDEMAELPAAVAGELSPTDWEQELPQLEEEEEAEDSDPGASSSMADEASGGRDGAEEDEDAAPRPQKQALLDRSGEADEGGLPGGDADGIPLGDTPEELAAAARKLGIDFRASDQSDAGVDPEMAKAAKELGISFREDSGANSPLDEEAAIEAQKLGISFRDGDTESDKPKKPKFVKYMPIILVATALVILLLLGVTFARDAIGWLTS